MGAIGFRRMDLDDLPLMNRWLQTEHVKRWWRGPETQEEVEAKYGPRIRGEAPAHCYLILDGGRPVGSIQTYLVADWPDYAHQVQAGEGVAGLDLFIGEPEYLHRGLGPIAMEAFLRQIVFSLEGPFPPGGARACLVGPEPGNRAAIRAYEKVGFRYWKTVPMEDEPEPEYLMVVRPEDLTPQADGPSLEKLVMVLDGGWHHGKPGASGREVELAAQTLKASRDPAEREAAARRLGDMNSASALKLACLMVADFWPRDDGWTPLALRLAVHPDWEVREWAVYPFASLLEDDLTRGLHRVADLARRPEPGVRRAVVVAVKVLAARKMPSGPAPLLGLLDSLLEEEDEYVRRNLGPFSVGDGLLRAYPRETLEALKQWASREAWSARWNVAMAFTAAAAAKHPEKVAAILAQLETDQRKEVRSAVRKARAALSRRLPVDERFKQTL